MGSPAYYSQEFVIHSHILVFSCNESNCMRRLLALIVTLFLVATACEEGEGFETDVKKTVELYFGLNTNDIFNNDGVIDFSGPRNIALSDFSEYINQIKDVEIHRVGVEITEIEETSALSQPSFSQLNLNLRSVGNNAQNLDFFKLESLPFANSHSMVLYKEDSTQSVEVKNAIDFIKSQFLLNEITLWDITGVLNSTPPEGDFVVKFTIDVTTTVVLR